MYLGLPQGQTWKDPSDKTIISKLEMTAPLMLCVVLGNYTVGWKGIARNPIFGAQKMLNLYIWDPCQKPRKTQKYFGLNPTSQIQPPICPTQSPAILHYLLQRYGWKPHLQCSENYEMLYLGSFSKTQKWFGWILTFQNQPPICPMPSRLLPKTTCNKPQRNPPPISWKCSNQFSKYFP